MATIKTPDGLNQLLRELTSLDADKMTDEMMKAAEPVMLEKLKHHAGKHGQGAMYNSIKSTGIKTNRSGKFLVVRPTGKDSKGVRNMEKMAYLEYGTYKQAATPVVTPAVKEAESTVERAMDGIFDKYMDKVR
jgi:HK97 gp10 family phage protein